MIRHTLFVLVLATGTALADADPAVLEASGNRHYELTEYTAAIADFKEAFRISDRPELLFNIAQAYRLAGDCVQARAFYKNYLRRLPAAENADRVKARIDELEACANKPAPIVQPTTTATPVVVAPLPPPVHHRTWLTKAGFAGLGGGALGIGVGIAFAVRGASKQDELRSACATSCTNERARSLDDAGHAANRNAVISLVAGGVLAAAGVVLIVVDGRERGPVVTPEQGGATVAWSWSF